MRFARRGKRTLDVEVTNVSTVGLWLLVDGRELFLPFKEFPWFRQAAIGQVVNVERPHPHHLYWPDLDVDLALESIEHPERYPLMSKRPPSVELSRARRKRRSLRARRRPVVGG